MFFRTNTEIIPHHPPPTQILCCIHTFVQNDDDRGEYTHSYLIHYNIFVRKRVVVIYIHCVAVARNEYIELIFARAAIKWTCIRLYMYVENITVIII